MSHLTSGSPSSESSTSSQEGNSTSSVSAPPKKPRRTRASNAKVKTGCLTCKRRHKKCDEARPSCMTCITKGYKCDGYAVPAPTKNNDTPRRSSSVFAQEASIDTIGPTTYPEFSSDELRFFDIFCKYTIPQLAGGFESSFWQTFIPRASYQVPCIRHAAIALASLHEDFAQGRAVVVDAQPTGTDTSFTMTQYGMAIRQLLQTVNDKGDGSTEIVLSVCVLFICFELLRGNHNAVLLHTQSGMNVLMDTMSRLSMQETPHRNCIVPLAAIAPVFTRIDVQASDILNTSSPGRFGRLTIPLPPAPIPYVFDNISHSKQSLLENQNYFMYKLREASREHGRAVERWPADVVDTMMVLRDEHIAIEEAWHQAHLRMVGRSDRLPRWALQRASDILLIHRLFLHIALRRFLSVDEMDFDRFTSVFDEIVSRAQDVLNSHRATHEQGPEPLTLSFDLGIAEPLFYVVSRCRNPHIRRRALALLKQCPSNEGIWNSSLASAMGEKIVNIEERASPSWPNVNSESEIPRPARILQAVPRFVKRTGDLVIAFQDIYGNHREPKIDWAGPASDKLLAGTQTDWPMGRFHRGVKSRLRLDVNTVRRASSVNTRHGREARNEDLAMPPLAQPKLPSAEMLPFRDGAAVGMYANHQTIPSLSVTHPHNCVEAASLRVQ